MKKRGRQFMFAFLFLCAVIMGSSQKTSALNPTVPEKGPVMYLNKTNITLNYKESYKFKVKNYQGEDPIVWTSSNPEIATISQKGTVKTKEVSGTVSISASAGGKYFTATVRVQKGMLSNGSLLLKKGDVYTLRKTVKKSAKWSTSNKKIATVSSSGKITAKKKGNCVITALIDKKKYKCKVTVDTAYSTVTITPETEPYNGKYMDSSTYNDKTRSMYTIRSYMTKFEKEGGGTIILSAGDYPMVNGAFVPSNVTIQLADGATIYKTWDTGTEELSYTVSVFSVINPSIVTAAKSEQAAYAAGYAVDYRKKYKEEHPKATAIEIDEAVRKATNSAVENSGYQFPSGAKAYNGAKNVVVKGARGGNSVIDHKGKFYTFGVQTGHAQNVTVQDIHFKNMDGNHFIELNSSKNVLVQRCTFTDDVTTYGYDPNAENKIGYYNDVIAEGKDKITIANKEAINIDTCDPYIKGFNNAWAYHDQTACDNITVQNCTFTRLVRPVGSHKYSASYNSKTKKYDKQIYCTNIKILNNTFIETGCNAITMCNWDKVTVTGNKIQTVDNSLENPYQSEEQPFKTFFKSINPSKKVNGETVIKTNGALKQKVAIAIFGGGSNVVIKNNSIDDAIVGVAAFNINNLNGGEEFAQSTYKLTAQNINLIKKNNKYSNISSGCPYFFAKESTFGSKSVSAKREYLPTEYSVDWTQVLDDYFEKFCSKEGFTKPSTEAPATTETTATTATTEAASSTQTLASTQN